MPGLFSTRAHGLRELTGLIELLERLDLSSHKDNSQKINKTLIGVTIWYRVFSVCGY